MCDQISSEDTEMRIRCDTDSHPRLLAHLKITRIIIIPNAISVMQNIKTTHQVPALPHHLYGWMTGVEEYSCLGVVG